MAATRATAAVAASVLRGVCVRNGHAAARPRRWCRPLSPVSRWSSSAAEASAATDGDRREQRVGAWSYGSGYLGALGHGSLHDADRPTLVRELAEVGADVTSIDCGWGHSAATTSDGVVVLWGRPYDFKQTLRTHHVHDFAPWLARLLGRISSKAILLGLEPTMIDGADDEEFVSVSCGAGALTAAVAASGSVYCVGVNFHGQCGNGATSAVEFDWVRVTGLEGTRIVGARCGFAHTLALSDEGQLFAWGRGHRGQLGLGDTHAYQEALPLSTTGSPLFDRRVVQFDAGFSHSAAVTDDGQAWVWGKMQGESMTEVDVRGARGGHVVEDQLVPRVLDLPAKAVAVACGHAHVCVVTEDDQIWLTGMRGRGRHYDGTVQAETDDHDAYRELQVRDDAGFAIDPVAVQPVSGFNSAELLHIRAGLHENFAVLKDGTVHWWGWQLRAATFPQAVGMNVRDVASGLVHTLMIADRAAVAED